MSTFTQVILGILTAVVILTAAGGGLIYLNSKAEEQKFLFLANLAGKLIPKTREQIAYENGTQAYNEAVHTMADFKKAYRKPEQCFDIQDHETRIFCANHFMRARKRWEAKQAKKAG
ncbi:MULTISPECIES: hypothetical protein [Methylomicrobium]|uniref:Uncharacterized protein n=1 Tax=Methylomicrobium album BG8 TaxID=686340 RepID=H8GQK5_METAL|nr:MULTISPECIES: hypothetical protein [Methylomicrobium]EIC29832.1 hypothetical protein Metal_2075 [Methylomicrobium album BG8]